LDFAVLEIDFHFDVFVQVVALLYIFCSGRSFVVVVIVVVVNVVVVVVVVVVNVVVYAVTNLYRRTFSFTLPVTVLSTATA
jgi:hypothetical protein